MKELNEKMVFGCVASSVVAALCFDHGNLVAGWVAYLICLVLFFSMYFEWK